MSGFFSRELTSFVELHRSRSRIDDQLPAPGSPDSNLACENQSHLQCYRQVWYPTAHSAQPMGHWNHEDASAVLPMRLC